MYIKLEKDIKVSRGNFGFVYEKTKEQELYDLLLACESVYKLNYRDFAHKLRMAYECIAVWFEVKYLKTHGLTEGRSDAELKREITRNVTNPNYTISIGNQRNQYYNFKNMLIRYTYDSPEKFETFLRRFSFDTKKSLRENLSYYIRYIYDFGSKSSHVGVNGEKRFQPNKRNVKRVLHSFHDFLCVLFSVNHRFSERDLPIRDFYPVPELVCQAQGLNLSDREILYIREEHGRVRYYLGVTEKTDISLKDKREMEAIRRLWEESYDDPSNIIRSADLIQGAEEGERYQFYSLADFPVSLSYTLLQDLSKEERRKLIQGIGKGIYSMHCCNPPVYHRNLCPEAFLLFKVQNHYKILLTDFQYSKSKISFSEKGGHGNDARRDLDDNSEETVFFDLKKLASYQFENDYFAPEMRGFTGNSSTLDWEKADVFSFGQLWIYIMTGFVLEKPEETYHLINRADISVKEKDILVDMLSWDAADRPHMKEVMSVMCPWAVK